MNEEKRIQDKSRRGKIRIDLLYPVSSSGYSITNKGAKLNAWCIPDPDPTSRRRARGVV
jgi:hypothetical protein